MNFITFDGKIVNTSYIRFIDKYNHPNGFKYAVRIYIDGDKIIKWYDDVEERDTSFKTLETILKQ